MRRVNSRQHNKYEEQQNGNYSSQKQAGRGYELKLAAVLVLVFT